MKWILVYERLALEDLKQLDGSQRKMVAKAISRVFKNPLPQAEGGYGKPLGSHAASNLTGLCKIVLKKLGIRVVYRIVKTKSEMRIIVIGMRSDEECYKIAETRLPQ